ncbi:adenylate/guanylate cyclase domain-containing protein [Fulvivirga maritima]|uniref:adenylate/guanylate cyclase domain-containing protein n=1 Tax=Fulvivirga maritima TaxID=2904247 RepID=UPI001F1C9394|nr:adenylate/guanylate cyclase domain-containing protein [Fulvivirga maritima]UII27344.1 adenylate/guanylate cyclase domain-containing protein [Fulvivirga maritima]
MRAIIRYKLQRLLVIIVYWIFVADLYVIVRYLHVGRFPQQSELTYIIGFDHMLAQAAMLGLIIGTTLGSLESFVYPKLLNSKSFLVNSIYRFAILMLLVILAMVTILLVFYFNASTENLVAIANFLWSWSFLSLCLFISVASITMDFILQFDKRVGPGMIYNMMTGKYRHPREEDRIFMFLDLQSSSSIAERLGHLKFSSLLQDCFRDLSGIVMEYNASIYQFVGDEAVLTWKTKHGLSSANCLKVFFSFRNLLEAKSSAYLAKYDHCPIFKASLHMGKITVAEVGELKSEVAYHGDVINTASRVQDLCNYYHCPLLVTEEVANAFNGNNGYDVSFVAETPLKGKTNDVKIFTIEQK